MVDNVSHCNGRTGAADEHLESSISENGPKSICCPFTKSLQRKLFIKRLSSNEQKHVIWICIILLSLFGGLYVRCYIFQRKSLELMPSDMALVDIILPFFCASISVCYEGNHIKGFVLKQLEFSKIQLEYNYMTSFMGNDKIWPISLLPNSSISMNLCSQGLIQLRIIQGKENFNIWRSRGECRNCLEYFNINSTCINYNLSHPEPNIYYHIIRNIGSPSLIHADIHLERTSYKMSDEDALAEKYSTCHKIPVKLLSTKYILLQLISSQWDVVKLTVVYNSRNYMFVVFFLLMPFSLALIFSLLTEKLIDDDIDEQSEEINDITDTQPVIEYIESCPPSYDSIFPESDPNTLPPYRKCSGIGETLFKNSSRK
ncbi:uncharacterized protein LOC115216439 [Argonauta hians]